MKFFKNRPVLAALCIILAVIISFVVAPLHNSKAAQKTEIVRVTGTIKKGDKIDAKQLETIKVGGYNLPDNVLKTVDEATGKYAAADLEKGDYILADKVNRNPLDDSAYLSKLDGTKQAVSISIKTFAAGMSGKLQSGDIISFTVANYGDTKKAFDAPELKYVKVLAATTKEGSDKDYKSAQEAKKGSDAEDDLPSTLTLLVSPEQKLRLVDYENNGILHASLAYRGSDKNGQIFLDKQDEYLQALEKTSGGTKNG